MARFRKGVSGNPKGRPRKDATTAPVRGIKRTALKRITASLIKKAEAGNLQAARILFSIQKPESIEPARAVDAKKKLNLDLLTVDELRTLQRIQQKASGELIEDELPLEVADVEDDPIEEFFSDDLDEPEEPEAETVPEPPKIAASVVSAELEAIPDAVPPNLGTAELRQQSMLGCTDTPGVIEIRRTR